MATIKLLIGIFFIAFIGSNRLFSRYLLTRVPQTDSQNLLRMALVNTASKEVGVRELTEHNDGVRVEAYLATVNLKKGEPYCASFISFVFAQCGQSSPRTGWCPDLFPPSRLARSALPGDVAGIYFPEKGRIAHVGLVVHQMGSWVTVIEANTNVAGSREGDGVYKKLRNIKAIRSLADWVGERKKIP